MDLFAIIGLCIISTILAVVLRQIKPEFAMFLSLFVGIFVLFKLFGDIVPIFDEMQAFVSRASIPRAYIEVLFKALGICIITQVAADACKDAGESAIAGKLEIAGRISVLLIAFPLFAEVLVLINELL